MIAVASTLAGLSVALGGCALGKIGEPVEIEGVPSQTYSVELDEREFEVSYVVSGNEEGRRVVFVHGTPGSVSAWQSFITEPIEGLESLALDRPGFGKTSPRRQVVSFEDQARAIEPLLVERDGRWPILVGHSLGGPIIARAAADYPDRVAGLVILSGSLDPALEKPRWFNRVGAFPLFEILLPWAMRHSNREIMAAPQETTLLDGVLENVRCPVIVVHGTKDTLVPYENVDYMRTVFGDRVPVTVIELDGAGHFIPWTHEALIRRVIERLASGLHASEEPLGDAPQSGS